METVAPPLDQTAPGSKPCRLLDQVRDRIRVKHYSICTEQTYVDWIKRYIVYVGKQHPADTPKLRIDIRKSRQPIPRKHLSDKRFHGVML